MLTPGHTQLRLHTIVGLLRTLMAVSAGCSTEPLWQPGLQITLAGQQAVYKRYKPDLQVWRKLLDHLAQSRSRYLNPPG